MTLSPSGPPPEVLRAFDVSGIPRLLPGGKGGTWRVGDAVLKPSEGADESRWRAQTLAAVPPSPDFRVPRPRRAAGGDWVVDGWEAWQAVAGEPAPARTGDILRAGSAFHAAVSAVPRPAFLDARADPWSQADRVAWEEAPTGAGTPGRELVERLARARRPVRLPSQMVHGDLLGNVLFDDDAPPAIIDWSPYWRPALWASAVAVADAVCWHGAGPAAVERLSHRPEWGQMLVRALIFRIVTRDARGPDARLREPDRVYRPAVDLAIAAAGRGDPAPESPTSRDEFLGGRRSNRL